MGELREMLLTTYAPIQQRGVLPVVVLSSEDLFARVVAVVRTLRLGIPVLSEEDAAQGGDVEHVGVW